MKQILESRLDSCLLGFLDNAIGNEAELICWTDALNWRGTAGFLLQELGELTHTWATLLGA
eukprot:578587-Pelagomonas_calceolata.AAC.1